MWLCHKDTCSEVEERGGGGGGGECRQTTIYFDVWWVLSEYNSFDHFPKRNGFYLPEIRQCDYNHFEVVFKDNLIF